MPEYFSDPLEGSDDSPSADPLSEALSEIATQDNLVSGAFLSLQRIIAGGMIAESYKKPFLKDCATCKPWEVLDIQDRLRQKFGKDFKSRKWTSLLADVKGEMQATTKRAVQYPEDLVRTENGKVIPCIENAVQFIRTSEEWAGVLGFNEFTDGIECLRPSTWGAVGEVEDHFDTEAMRWIERASSMAWKPENVHRAIDAVARANPFHPIKRYLESLPPWDRVERLSTWLVDYMGVDPGSDERPAPAGWQGRKWMISAVARIFEPGCKADHMLVLEGKTGLGKSTAAAMLCADEKWFTDKMPALETPDAALAVRGAWIIEFSDLDRWSKADETTAKAFISRREERFRVPYGRRLTRYGRQCVFIGTTEQDDWSRSETIRRQWPVRCTRIDIEALNRDRDQLWAEALAAYRAHEKWHPEKDEAIEAAAEQRKRYSEDIIITEVLRVIPKIISERMEETVTIPLILKEMGYAVDKWSPQTQARVATILRMNGWEKVGHRVASGWRRVE